MQYFSFLFLFFYSANLLSQVTSVAESSLRTEGQYCCNPARTFFQNDWDGNDRDNRYVARDWEKYNLGRFATALSDPKNLNSTPASVTVRSFEEGGRLVAAASLKGNVDLIMGGGSGQMLALVKEVIKQGGDLSNILVIDHSPSNRNNVEGRAGQYPPFDTAWDELKGLVRTKTLPNQNYHAYGWLDSAGQQNRPKTDDVSDLGMLHYVCFGEEEPSSQKLFEKDVKHCQIPPALSAPTGLTTEYLRVPEKAIVTSKNPRFGWVFPIEGVRQSAYRVLVASSPFLLREGLADMWDSGVVNDISSVNIAYSGKDPGPNSVYWWQVKVWSDSGSESPYSDPQQFLTGSHESEKITYTAASNWVEAASDQWLTKDRQSATFQNISPRFVEQTGEGSFFADFGQSAFSTLGLTIYSASDNNLVTVHQGERRNADKSVHKNPGVSNIAYNKSEIALKAGTHYYQIEYPERPPSHYLHTQDLAAHFPEVLPFRYVEVTGDPGSFNVNDLQQGALFYYFDDNASSFQSSNNNLNQVWDLCKYTLKATPFLGVYADGNRERMPYEADAYIQQLGHYAVDREYSISKYTIHFLLDHASWPTEWHLHMVLMAWEYYMHTGDLEFLKERYDDIKRKTLIALTDENGLISTRTGKVTEDYLRSLNFPGPLTQFRDIVDWPHGRTPGEPARNFQSPFPGGEIDGYVFTDYNTVVNALHYRSLVLMSKIARETDNLEDYNWFRERSVDHKKAFNDVFYDASRGVFTDGESTDHSSLHANAFPLALGLVDSEYVPAIADYIKGKGMACGVYGAQYLLEALYTAGEAQHALNLMTSDDKRSWMNMIRVGSSMTTEAWDESFKPNLTWNHAWGAAPANIIPRKLLGIEPTAPAFKKFRIVPQPASIESVSIRIPTLRGPIDCQLIAK